MSARVSSLAIADIRRDGGTQARAGLDEDTVVEYAEILKEKPRQLPPVNIVHDGVAYWLVDGFHRVEGALRAGLEKIDANVSQGTQRDAILQACGANYEHGLRRSNADKRRAIETLLSDPEWREWSDGVMARAVRVSRQTVSNVRAELRDERLAILPVELQRVTGLDGRERTRPAKDSESGQPTPVPPPAGNPTDEGEKGAGVSAPPTGAGVAPAAPAPDEPRDRLINVERMLRDAQAEIAPLLAKGEALAVQAALVDALFLVRAAIDKPAPSVSSMETLPARMKEAYVQTLARPVTEPPRRAPERIEATRERIRRLRIEDDTGRELTIERDEDGAAEAATEAV